MKISDKSCGDKTKSKDVPNGKGIFPVPSMCAHACTRAPFTLLLLGGYVYYTRVKWLHASGPLISPIHHRVAEKKSNNIACTATFTRVYAREIARSPVPRDDPQTYGSTRSCSILQKIREIRADGNQRGMKRERKEKKKENGTRRIQRARFQWDYSYPLTDEFITIEDCTRETMEVEHSIEIE